VVGNFFNPERIAATSWNPSRPIPALQTDARIFSTVTVLAKTGSRLHVARWPGGSCAWLDHRDCCICAAHDPTVLE